MIGQEFNLHIILRHNHHEVNEVWHQMWTIYELINNSLTIGPIYFVWYIQSWLAYYANDRLLHNTHYIQLKQ